MDNKVKMYILVRCISLCIGLIGLCLVYQTAPEMPTTAIIAVGIAGTGITITSVVFTVVKNKK